MNIFTPIYISFNLVKGDDSCRVEHSYMSFQILRWPFNHDILNLTCIEFAIYIALMIHALSNVHINDKRYNYGAIDILNLLKQHIYIYSGCKRERKKEVISVWHDAADMSLLLKWKVSCVLWHIALLDARRHCFCCLRISTIIWCIFSIKSHNFTISCMEKIVITCTCSILFRFSSLF